MLSSNIFRFLDEPIYGFHLQDPFVINRSKRNNLWSTSIPVTGYQPNEVAIKEEKDDKGEMKIIVHGKHENDDDYSEFKKSIKIPDNVDQENLRTVMSSDGQLILKAPYKSSMETYITPIKLKRKDSWNGIWGEIGRMNSLMNQLIDSSNSDTRPKTEYIANESGDGGLWRLKVNIGKDFKADEIKLRNHNNQIYIDAKKETKTNDLFSSKYVSEVISLPDGIEQDKLKSKFLDNGELIIEAASKIIPSIEKPVQSQVIPIEISKSADSEKMAIDNN